MNTYKQELENKLNDMDALLKKANMDLELVIVGGAAFILKNLVPRATSDFDFINQTNQKAINMLNQKGFDVNGRVDTFIYQFGTCWHMDLELIIKTDNLTVKTISTERLMVSRLFSNKRHEDFEASVINGTISQDKFEEVFEDVYSVAYEMSQRNFKENVYMVRELYDKKGWDYESSNIKHLCNY